MVSTALCPHIHGSCIAKEDDAVVVLERVSSFDPRVLDDATSEEVENLLKELTVMKLVGKHANIISLLGCCTKGGNRYVELR